MKLYQKRVVAEKKALDAKRGKLAEFMEGEKFDRMMLIDRSLLERQAFAMREYSVILGGRIKRFEELEGKRE